jgi:hypothetical protein
MVGWFLKYVEPKSKVVYWFPHNFFFELKKENVVLQTNSLTIQNLGRKPAETVEIVHKQRPDFFQLSPALAFTEETTTNGEHVIRVATLGRKEVFTVQLLSYKTAPVLLNIRSKDGAAQGIAIQPQRIFPRWFNVGATVLLFLGLGFFAYWAIKAVVFISKSIGIVPP